MTTRQSYWSTLRACLPFALRRRVLPATTPDPLPEVWVVSPGGVGTTAIMQYIGRFRRINAPDDTDQLKHLPAPPRLPPGAPTRFLYITGPADDIYSSLLRRGYVEDQAANLGAPLAVILRGPLQRASLLRAVRRQERRWTTATGLTLLTIDYADLFESGARIAAFLGITDPAFVANYPRRRKRTKRG